MTGSLRLRLFVTLIAATGIVWVAAVAWIYLGSRHEVEQVLDTRLQEAARMVASLASGLEQSADGPSAKPVSALGSYERQLSCQVWSFDGRMIARSSGAPDQRLSEVGSGFSARVIDGESWRVYSVEDAERNVRVMVGDRMGLRERLVSDLIKGLLWPALLIAPLLGAATWVSVGRGLRPLSRMAGDLAQRDADDMKPVDGTHAPEEVRPLASAINSLFEKVEAARRHEREITAFAAHELRTPLAGLKTQAQVALAATDPTVVREALSQIVSAVDRSARLVRQLLEMARLDAQRDAMAFTQVDLGSLLQRVVDTTDCRDDVRVKIDERLAGMIVTANVECVELAVRNLHENAVQYSVRGGVVGWHVEGSRLVVEDDGPGLPEEEIRKVGTRFFRGSNRSPTGSGLGVAIAHLALEKTGAALAISNRCYGGLRCEIRLSCGPSYAAL